MSTPDAPLPAMTIAITGGTSGIGLHTAQLLAAGGAHVTVIGANPTKGASAVAAITQAAGAGGGTASFVAADLSSMREVHALAATLRSRLHRLDVLINNAGVISQRRQVTTDGYERTFAVNYLAPFALTVDLLPLLRASAPARVVALTAAVEPLGRLPFGNLQRARHYGGLHEVAAGGAFEFGVGGNAGDPPCRGGWFDHGGPGGFEKQGNVVVAGQVGADEERVDDVGGDVVVLEAAGQFDGEQRQCFLGLGVGAKKHRMRCVTPSCPKGSFVLEDHRIAAKNCLLTQPSRMNLPRRRAGRRSAPPGAL